VAFFPDATVEFPSELTPKFCTGDLMRRRTCIRRSAKSRSQIGVQHIEELEGRMLLAGNGLSAVYYNSTNLTGSNVSRTDATVNFNWKGAKPASTIAGDQFSARWTGQIQPNYSQTYTFSTVSDDGVRLWVNGSLIINQWNRHAAREDKGTITLQAGHKYSIKMEYFQSYGGSVAQLWWASASQAKQIVPQAQLYSTATTPPSSIPPTQVPTTPSVTGSLRISSNGRYLMRANGTPFFYLADTAWQMPIKLDRADVDYYLKDRAAKGFTAIQMVALDTPSDKNRYGQQALLNNNPATPNQAFFQQIDYIVSKAASLGLYISFMPTWGRNVGETGGRMFNTSNAYAYGKYLGNRYRNAWNIIWINGGDTAVNNATAANIWRSLAQGLNDGDGGAHLITFHPLGGRTARTYWANQSWLDFDMLQSGHTRDSAAWNMVTTDYNKGPVMPVIEGEANYEDIPTGAFSGNLNTPLLDAYDVRKKAYWETFAGAAGTAYGANEVFQFWNPGQPADIGAHVPWKTALNLPGATQVKYLRGLMESRVYFNRVPDQSLVVSATYSGTDHIQATRDAGGAYAMVYSASGKAFTVNMSKITGGAVNAAWYDPRTGKVTPIGKFANTGTRTFTPPTHGYGQDWVLTLDRA